MESPSLILSHMTCLQSFLCCFDAPVKPARRECLNLDCESVLSHSLSTICFELKWWFCLYDVSFIIYWLITPHIYGQWHNTSPKFLFLWYIQFFCGSSFKVSIQGFVMCWKRFPVHPVLLILICHIIVTL